jgi:hypothetical protein
MPVVGARARARQMPRDPIVPKHEHEHEMRENVACPVACSIRSAAPSRVRT